MTAVRPLVRTVVLGLIGLAIIGVGWAIASRPAVAGGALLVIAIIVDAIRFRLFDARRPFPHLVRTVGPNPAPAGQAVSVTLLSDDQLDPWPVEETLPGVLSTTMTVNPVFSQRSGSVCLAYEIRPPCRGQWTLGPCTTVRFSPLGLWWTRVVGRTTSQVTAWPRTAAIGLPGLAQDREGSAGLSGFVQPHQDNATVREYRPGDDMRRVHWRLSARRGELMTRAEEPTDSERAWAGVMVPVTATPQRRELAISLAASWLVELERAGFTVDLACGGQLYHGTSAEHLTQLAALTDAQAGRPLPANVPEGVSLLVLARGNTPVVPAMVVRPPYGLSWRAVEATAVVLSDESADTATVEAVGWRALRVAGGASLEQAAAGLSAFIDKAVEAVR